MKNIDCFSKEAVMQRGGKRPGAGRKQGVPNIMTSTIKEAICEAFNRAGGVDYLTQLAKDDSRAFCGLLAKIIPAEVKAELTHSPLDRADLIWKARKFGLKVNAGPDSEV